MQGLTDKSESLAKKMNKITDKLTNNLDLADEMDIQGDDIIEFVEEKTEQIKLVQTSAILTAEIINLNTMVEDFKYIRDTLKDNTDNGKRILDSVTLDLLDVDDEKRIELITSFVELNRAVAENMKLYIQAYREISNVLVNITKINQAEPDTTTNQTNNTSEPVSTVDLIRKLS